MLLTSFRFSQIASSLMLAERCIRTSCTLGSHVFPLKHLFGAFQTMHSIRNPGIGFASGMEASSISLRNFLRIRTTPL